MQEHPEDYTDEQINDMLSENPELTDLLEQLSQIKRAVVRDEVQNETIPIDDLWEQFAFAHQEELSSLDSEGKKHIGNAFSFGRTIRRIASVIGILLTISLAYATIRIANNITKKEKETKVLTEKILKPQHKGDNQEEIKQCPIVEEHDDSSLQQKNEFLQTDTLDANTSYIQQTIVFDNVTLEKILPEIVAYYNSEVEIQNDEVRQLRFYFVWKQDESLEEVIQRLDRFESINVKLNENKVIVR